MRSLWRRRLALVTNGILALTPALSPVGRFLVSSRGRARGAMGSGIARESRSPGSYGRIRSTMAVAILAALIGESAVSFSPSQPAVANTPTHSSDTALQLTGGYASVNARVIPSSGSFTVQTWFKDTNTNNVWPVIVSQGTSTSFRIQRNGNGTMHWQYGIYGSNFGWLVPADQWTHVSFTYNEASSGNSIRIYINGNQSYSWNMGTTRLSGVGSNFFVGGFSNEPNTTAYRWRGSIDETRVFTRALTLSEVETSMHAHGPENSAGLVGYYDFNDETLTNKATGADSQSGVDLSVTGTTAWEDIAQIRTVGNQNFVAFTKSYLSKDDGWPLPPGAASINYLVVGGGGGSGARHGGGGGAGAFVEGVTVPVSDNEKLDVVVGAGGISGINALDGSNGGESKLNGSLPALSASAIGGGGGGGGGRTGRVGASGGGGGAAWGPGADGTPGLGNKGGSGRFFRYSNGGENWHGGGGGGVMTAGTAPLGNGDLMHSGNGGAGKTVSWFGSFERGTGTDATRLRIGQVDGNNVYFGGGGAGGKLGHGRDGRGGLGGGGNPGRAALPNSGGGGGGGSGGSGGAGGAGVVLISFSTVPNVPQDFTAKALTDERVDLTWSDPVINGAAVTDYIIEHSLVSNFSSDVTSITVPKNLDSPNQTYSVTGLTEATQYFFRVSAKNPTSTGAPTASKNARTWVKVENGECVTYVSSATGVSIAKSGKDSCEVTFASGSVDWAIPPGATTVDALVVGGGGGGGSEAGSGGAGGSVVDLGIDLGLSQIPFLSLGVGNGGVAGADGQNSTLSGTDGTHTISVTSTGGPGGKNSDTAPGGGTDPTVTSTGSAITLSQRAKRGPAAGGGGQDLTDTSATTGSAGSAGYTSSVFVGGYAGGGGGGAVALGPIAASISVSYSGTGTTGQFTLTFPDEVLSNTTINSAFTPDFTFTTPGGVDGTHSVTDVQVGTDPKTLVISVEKSDPIDGTPTLSYISANDRTLSANIPSIGAIRTLTDFAGETNGSLIPFGGPTFLSTTSGSATQGGGAGARHTTSGGSFGTVTAALPGSDNTGGGGGAGVYTGDSDKDAGAAGGSGVVKLRYKLVNAPLVLTSPDSATVAAGEPVSFSASFASVTSSIKWQYSANGGATWLDVTDSPTTNSATSTYTIASALTSQSGLLYRAMGTNVVGSASAFSVTEFASLTVTKDAETLPVGAFCDGTSTQNGLTAAAGHGKVFYIDTGQGQEIDAGYVAYTVSSDKARNDLWVEISGFSGGVISLADPSTGSMPLGAVTENGSGAAFFLLKATGATLTAQSHIIRVYNQKPSIGNPAPIYECNYSFTRVEETIKAAANKVNSVVATSVSSIGSTMTVTVKGDSGTIGQGNDIDGRMFWLIPAARSTWPVSAVRLESTNLSLFATVGDRDSNTSALASFDDTLRVNNTNGLPANSRQFWTATYTFRIIGPASATAPIIPVAMISSGTQIKHTDVGSLPSGLELNLADPPPPINLSVTKDVSSAAQVRDDGTTRFEYVVNLKNTGSVDLTVDEVIDTPDPKAAYVTGSSTYNSAETDSDVTTYTQLQQLEPAKIGTTSSLGFSGPLVIPANSTTTIKYLMAIETCKTGQSYSLENTAIARSGSIVIGSDSAKQSVVTINANCGESDINVFVDEVVMDPDVVTGQSHSVAQTTATITGVIDPNGVAGRKVRFSYSTSPTLASPTFENLADTTSATTPVNVSQGLESLTAETTYYYRLEVEVDGKWIVGETLTFTTLPAATPPAVKTTAVTAISSDGSTVTFTGTVDANLTSGGVKAKFEYGEAGANGTCGPANPFLIPDFLQSEVINGETVSGEDALVTGHGPTPMSFVQTGLTANTTYCVRIVGYHGDGFETATNGQWESFTTTAKLPQVIVWSTGTNPLPAGGTTTVVAFADSGLSVTYTSVDSTICSVHPTTGVVTAVATSGNCVITATREGNDSFYDATPSTISFLISPPVITTTSLPTGTYASAYSEPVKAIGGDGAYSSWAWTGEVPPGLVLNPATGEITGTPTLAGIYVVFVTTVSNGIRSETQPLTITINKVAVNVTASSSTLTFGDGAPRVTASYDESAFLSPDTSAVVSAPGNVAPTCQTNYTAGMFVGDETAFTSCGGGWATNYSYSYAFGTITILPFELTIRVVPASKTEGSADPAFTYTVSPALPPGQVLAHPVGTNRLVPNQVLKDGEEVTFTRTAGETPGQYTITPSAVLQDTYAYLDASGEQYLDEDGVGLTKPYENYKVTFESAQLTITAKKTPTLGTTNGSVTFGTSLAGLLNAEAKDGQTTVPGSFRYSYINHNGTSITVTNASLLPAGTYSITATFTPTDGVTYFGPVSSVFTVTVNPYPVTLRALNAAKQNLRSTTQLTVRPDPAFDFLLSPPIPAGQQFSDVFPNGVTVSRALSGTAAGNYPTSNTTIGAKEGAATVGATEGQGIHRMTPHGEISPNYAVTIVPGVFTITELLVPTVDIADSSKTVGATIGTRLNATATIDGVTVPGTLVYSYFDSTGTEVVVTSQTALPLGLYSIQTTFTPADTTTYFGPVYTSMILTVNPVVASGNTGGGTPNRPPRPRPPLIDPSQGQGPTPIGPNQNPQTGNNGNGTNGANGTGGTTGSNGTNGVNGSNGNNGGNIDGGGAGSASLYANTAPFAPGFGSLLSPGPSAPGGANGSGSGAAGSGGGGSNGNGSGSANGNQMAGTLSGMTVDVGRGIEPAEASMLERPLSSLSEATRTLSQVSRERLAGFYPPGSGVRIEVLGARTGARFVVSDVSQIDAQAMMRAMSRSISAQRADFFAIEELTNISAPQMPTPWSAQESLAITEFFSGAGLSEPLSLASVDSSQVSTWIGIRASASTYAPGSVVFLTVTSTPLVLGSGVVDENGEAIIEGAMPVEFLGAGEHRIRLVGTRLLDGVFVDDAGEIQVTEQTLTEIERFDLRTHATIAFMGGNESLGNHVALRVIPLTPVVPWWTLVLLGLVGFVVFGLRRRDIVFAEHRKPLAVATIVLAAVPAVIFGWLSSVTEVAWWGLGLALALAAGSWFVRSRRVREESQAFLG